MFNLELWRNDRSIPRSILDDIWGVLDTYNRGFDLANSKADHRMLSYDVAETENNYTLSLDVPGIKKEDLNIEVTGHHLLVSGERKRDEEFNSEGSVRREKSYGKFQRSFELPESVDTENVEAQYENGVLKLVLHKAEKAKTRKIQIGEGQKGFLKKLTSKPEKGEAKTANA